MLAYPRDAPTFRNTPHGRTVIPWVENAIRERAPVAALLPKATPDARRFRLLRDVDAHGPFPGVRPRFPRGRLASARAPGERPRTAPFPSLLAVLRPPGSPPGPRVRALAR